MDGGDGVGMEVTLIGDFYWAQDGFLSLLGADHHCGKGNLSIVLALRWILSKLSTQLFGNVHLQFICLVDSIQFKR